MRCAGCAGQIPEGSQFCGVCGRGISHAPLAAGEGSAVTGPAGGGTSAEAAHLDADGSLSLFELPVSPTARRTKIILVLALDAILAGAGIAMILSYRAAASVPARPAGPAPQLVEALEPHPVTSVAPATDAGPAAQENEVKPRSGSRREGDESKARRKPAKPEPAEKGSADEQLTGPARAGEDRDGDNVGDAGPGHDAGSADVEAEVAQIASRMAAAVARHQGELERCYQSAAKSAGPQDPMKGRISIRFTLMPNGSTAQARVVRDDIGSVALATCVLDRFQSWPMPAGVSQPIELEWPFEFHAPTP